MCAAAVVVMFAIGLSSVASVGVVDSCGRCSSVDTWVGRLDSWLDARVLRLGLDEGGSVRHLLAVQGSLQYL